MLLELLAAPAAELNFQALVELEVQAQLCQHGEVEPVEEAVYY
jgi:hypothetical protein